MTLKRSGWEHSGGGRGRKVWNDGKEGIRVIWKTIRKSKVLSVKGWH
jgi:hypothetical protein